MDIVQEITDSIQKRIKERFDNFISTKVSIGLQAEIRQDKELEEAMYSMFACGYTMCLKDLHGEKK